MIVPKNARLRINIPWIKGKVVYKCPFCRGALKEELHWMDFCKSCKKNHHFTLRPCLTCDTYETPQPVSEKVYERCNADYSCDGCVAFRDHTNPY